MAKTDTKARTLERHGLTDEQLRQMLRNNAALISQAAAGFGVSTILTTVAEKTFSGPMYDEITGAFPSQPTNNWAAMTEIMLASKASSDGDLR